MADFSTEKIVTQRNHAQSKKASAHSFGISKNLRNLVTDAFSLASSPSQSSLRDARFPLLSLRDIFPRPGEVGPQSGSPWQSTQTASLCQGLSLWERWICEAKTERARLLTVCSNLPHIRYQRSRSRPLPSCRQTAHSPWWRGGRHPRRTPPSSSGS